MIRKNIYKWHRTMSLIIALPVFLWALSGFLHPVMTTFRPKVATQVLPVHTIDSSKLKVSLQDALEQNNIYQFSNFRIVCIKNNWFYQVKLPSKTVLVYISTESGKILKNGDELYARDLAKQFLSGAVNLPVKESIPSSSEHHLSLQTASVTGLPKMNSVIQKQEDELHDCCINATASILNDTNGLTVTGVELIENFNTEYKYVNRLLPVYKVSFEREDGIRIFVETQQDRFAFAMNNTRAVCDMFFSLFHTLSWLDFLGKGKYIVEGILMLMSFLTAVMGIYIFCITKTKRPNGNPVLAARRNHRWTAIPISLFTLLFTFSGGYHALSKLKTDDRNKFTAEPAFSTADADFNMEKLCAAIGGKQLITNLSLVKVCDSIYWQVYNRSAVEMTLIQTTGNNDIMKNRQAETPATVYVNTVSGSVLQDGERNYARYIASVCSGKPLRAILSTDPILKFKGEYGFVNKRLPVWRVGYKDSYNPRYYIETSTGKVAAIVDDIVAKEGLSFAFLHKHEFMAWAGKPIKDFSTMFWAFSQIVVVGVGLILYFKIRRNRSKKSS